MPKLICQARWRLLSAGRLLSLGAVLFASLSSAEDENGRRAREEVERQLHQMVGSPPTKVRIDFSPLDEPNYVLEEASFDLDGRPLVTPTASELAREGTHLVWNGDVKPGRHSVHAHVVYANPASIVVSDEGGHKWKVTGDVSFDVPSGIEVQVEVVPTRDPSQRDVGKRLRLSLPARPIMLARLDDGKMPEPIEAPAIAGQAPEEAETATVAESRARPKKARTDAETTPRKRRAANPSPELAEAAADPAEAAADPAEAAADPAEAAADPAEAPPDPVAPFKPPSPDAAVASGPLPVQRPPSGVEEGEVPWAVIGGAGGLSVVVLLVVLLRRRGS